MEVPINGVDFDDFGDNNLLEDGQGLNGPNLIFIPYDGDGVHFLLVPNIHIHDDYVGHMV